MAENLDPDDVARLKDATLTLPELLDRFGFRLRNYESVPVISAALEAAGLITDPPFTDCGRKTPIRIKSVDASDRTDAEPAEEFDSADGFDLSAPPQQKFTVGQLAVPLTSVSSTDELSHALTCMRTNNFSQVPVIDGPSEPNGPSELKGTITWDSLALLQNKPHLEQNLTNAIDPKPPVADANSDLFQRLSEICHYGYVLVRDNLGRLTGIVTTADVTEHFHTIALPFFLVGEIEILLRHCLSPITADAIKAAKEKDGSGKVQNLMFGATISLIQHDHKNATQAATADANWKALNWKTINRVDFVQRLREVKNIRNSIAHFDGKPPTEAELTELRQFKALLEQLA
ncbi:CBS domain-containing protein [Nocardia acidivorans]|uniref:CBS domain-containing protein n=1 Tax=Nocardia acidivorans TaxID=404580 RepID=UPI00083236B7|nr:CBS domain-containing protein [Nocardia acidivorans]